MQALSDKQLKEVTRIILDHHTAFMVNVLGMGDAVDPAEVERLRRQGLISATAKSYPNDTFLFGFLSDALGEADAKGLSYNEFKDYIAHRPLSITSEERYAVKHLKRSLMQHVQGLGNKMNAKTHEVLVEADQGLRRRLAAELQAQLIEGIEKRKSMSKVVTELRKATKDYARDWFRIVSTELNNAYQEGRLQTIMKANKGRDPLVFKRPRPDCCIECSTAYLEKGNVPKIFTLSEMVGNGTNVGRNKRERLPVIGSHHPWCMCELHELPPGFDFNSKGEMFYAGV